MENTTELLTLPYQFKAGDLIAEGRVRREDVEKIRTFVSKLKKKYVPSSIQDETIVLFLISCANDVELTKKTIISFYLFKFEDPEIYDNRDLNNIGITTALNTLHLSSIPVRTEENVVFHYFNLHDTNYKNFDLIQILKLTYMLIDVSQEKNPPDGLITIFDFKGCGLMHLTKLKLQAVKKYMMFLQDGLPLKLKMIHIIINTCYIEKFLAIIKIFIKSELMSKIIIHPPNMEPEELFRIIPKKYLPKEYGGDLPSEAELHQKTLEQFKSKQEFWKIEEKIRKQAYSA